MTVGTATGNYSSVIADAIAKAMVQLVRQPDYRDTAIQLTSAWQALKQALDQSNLTPRQRELVLLDMMGLRRAQIADIMGVSPGTLTTYWKAIYDRYNLHGVDARSELHQRLFPHFTVYTMRKRY